MKETIYKIIGKRGRTTIPTSFRTALKITNDTVENAVSARKKKFSKGHRQ